MTAVFIGGNLICSFEGDRQNTPNVVGLLLSFTFLKCIPWKCKTCHLACRVIFKRHVWQWSSQDTIIFRLGLHTGFEVKRLPFPFWTL